MLRRPPRSTLPDTRFPSTTLLPSPLARRVPAGAATVHAPAHPRDDERAARRRRCRARPVGELRDVAGGPQHAMGRRSEEPTSELQSLMRISYAVFCLKNKTYRG